jgi:general stress protein YciG
MAGTKEGGQLTRETNLAKYGKDYYQKLGAKGGSTKTSRPKGFAAMSKEKVSAAGKLGGQRSKRGRRSDYL